MATLNQIKTVKTVTPIMMGLLDKLYQIAELAESQVFHNEIISDVSMPTASLDELVTAYMDTKALLVTQWQLLP